ncbi:membrane protein [Arthrobacter phage Sarge]|uniref:Membrane protein n=1 Tax=Arthrobacter phage Sarge TaxID=2885974 RepID=A0AAE8Y6G8_9CAUD|nr:membrane protein [Arthrobacter phage Sarge]UDL14885.1 membrane protein [Arthrobacter phage Sarge]
MSWPILISLVLCIGFGVAIPWALRADYADAHLLHGPNSGCPECGDK